MPYSGSMVILSNVGKFRKVTTKALSGKDRHWTSKCAWETWATEMFSEKTKQVQMSCYC